MNLNNKFYPDTFLLLPNGIKSREIGHPMFIKRDAEGVPVGSQADIDALRPYDLNGVSTGAFMALQAFIDANTRPDGGCNYVIDGFVSPTHFILHFPITIFKHPVLGTSEADRLYSIATDAGLVELTDLSAPLVGNEFKFMDMAMFHVYMALYSAAGM